MPPIDFAQLGLALLEGVGLVLSPCILPILPIMLAASLDGGKARPLGIVTGFIGAFTGFALLSRQILEALKVDPEIVRDVALGLLVLFGLIMLSKKLSDKLLGATQGLADLGQNLAARWDNKKSFASGIGIGALIGLIWTPCAGPIMAAAIVQIIQAKTSIEATLTVVLFAVGAGVPMLLIALLGRRIMSRLTFLKTHSYAVRRGMGVVIIAVAALIYSGADVQLIAASDQPAPAAVPAKKAEIMLANPYPAPELAGIQDWVNSKPLKIADLRGKVVLVDFWTYSCINCVRTLPYLIKWDNEYRSKGLVIIGVHSPEFAFEKNLSNVVAAAMKYGIHYPIALDNFLSTWGNFKNRYWPAHYLIDKEGRVVYTHFGEGDYDVTENAIRNLLGLAPVTPKPDGEHFSPLQTPETYLGYARAKNFASVAATKHDLTTRYAFPSALPLNNWALSGDWLIGPESIMAQKPVDGSSDSSGWMLRFNFDARKVFLVLGTNDGKPIDIQVLLNGKPVEGAAGADAKNGTVTVNRDALYELINQGETKGGVLELHVSRPGLRAYAFTFGT